MDTMYGLMIGGILTVAAMVVWCLYLDMKNIRIYEKAVRSWLEDDPDCYVEQVMYDFHDAGRRPFDAATEMRAMHYED